VARFPSTHWSLIGRTGRVDPLEKRQALGELFTRYWPALKAHLVGRNGFDPDRADDLLQGFVTSKILEQGVLSRVEPAKGKFRTWLLTILDRYVVSQRRFQSAAKRSAASVSLDAAPEFAAGARGVDAFDLAWAREVLVEVLRRLEADCALSGRLDIWRLFESRVLGPVLNDAPPVPYDQLVERLGFSSPEQAANALVTAKRMFVRQLRGVVGEYAAEEDAIQEEIRDLRRILAEAGAG
jgi:RNA polymerase sigma-70 factor (ECF subfamily)